MNETSDAEILTETRGAFADGLTLIRFILTPVIMAIIVMGWPSTQVAVLATALLIIAAVTDIFDDIIGGSERSKASLASLKVLSLTNMAGRQRAGDG